MSESDPNVAVKLTIGLMAMVTLVAWLLSERRNRATRALARYLETHAPQFWATQPWLARHLLIFHAVERYRRIHGGDPAFAALYAARRRSARKELAALLAAGALVALLLAGTAYWGWHF